VSYKQGGRLWTDPYIQTGDVWRREVIDGLARARIGVLLVSPDFLASEFIRNVELPALLEAAAKGDLTLVCVPVRTSVVDLALPELLAYQWPLKPHEPLALPGLDSEAALTRVFRSIYELAEAHGLVPHAEPVSGLAPAAKPVRMPERAAA
jgi:hypothetical protein